MLDPDRYLNYPLPAPPGKAFIEGLQPPRAPPDGVPPLNPAAKPWAPISGPQVYRERARERERERREKVKERDRDRDRQTDRDRDRQRERERERERVALRSLHIPHEQ
jgi:hypothetical protein